MLLQMSLSQKDRVAVVGQMSIQISRIQVLSLWSSMECYWPTGMTSDTVACNHVYDHVDELILKMHKQI
jgi:hypothetical protein